jgi:hypothetical protein
MRPISFAVACLLVLALPPASARAQVGESSNSIWVSAGIGGGWNRVSCSICRTQRNLGPTGYIRVGASVRDGVLLGAEVNGWMRERGGDNGREWTGAIGPVAYLYPYPRGSFYVKGGLGYMKYRINGDEDDEAAQVGSIGVQLGAGYEFRIGNRLHITNYVNLLASSFGALRADDALVLDDVSVSMLQIGIGITRR